MKEQNNEHLCTECKIPMRKEDVTPCICCGGDPKERTHSHEFYKCDIYNKEVIMCDFCYYDFPSIIPEFLGLDSIEELEDLIKFTSKITINNKKSTDFVCPKCNERLVWQNLIQTIKNNNS